MNDEEWIKQIKTYLATPEASEETATPAPTVINNYFIIDASTNIQAVVTDGATSARLKDNRERVTDALWEYLPSNYRPTSMDAIEAKILSNPDYGRTPLTKEERAALNGRGW